MDIKYIVHKNILSIILLLPALKQLPSGEQL